MTDITINVPEEGLAKLREMAAAYGISAEELVRASIDQLLGGPEEEFQRVADYVLKKNAKLYQRLA
jgi:antitoxin FitA